VKEAYRSLRDHFRSIRPAKGGHAKDELLRWTSEHYKSRKSRRISEDARTNGVMLQAFHWYLSNDGKHWQRLKEDAAALAAAGFTSLWIPPATKGAAGTNDVGYAVYDLFDLGEFVAGANPDPHGDRRTKYGTKDDYLAAVKALSDNGLQVYADVVFNHKMGGESEEDFEAIPFDPNNRNQPLGEARTIRSYTSFSFPDRSGKYSEMHWTWAHFTAVDYNSLEPDFHAIWRKKDQPFSEGVDLEKGNYDYLMGCDLDMDHPETRGELVHWGKWMLDTAPIAGFRLDAIKHIENDFFPFWLDAMEEHAGREIFCVGEYWTHEIDTLSWYIGSTGGRLSLFDAPLQNNFHRASKEGSAFNLCTLLDGTLMNEIPTHAVTLVENHDTQPLQALESVVEAWFKPLAYAFILLREEGYPCVFHADYYGAEYDDRGYHIVLASHKQILDCLLHSRREFAYGPQQDYFDHPNTIGWTRLGDDSHPHALAVVMSNGDDGTKWMATGKPGAVFRDVTGHVPDMITTNADGWAEFRCPAGSVSVWVDDPPSMDEKLSPYV
jgi:alpha-amylase